MRVRLALVMAMLVVGSSVLSASAAFARPFVVAQEQDGGSGTDQGAEDTSSGQGQEGQSDPEAETGAGAGSQEGAEPEEGPPWTYQMAKISLVLLLLVFLGMGLSYWKLIGSRQRAA
jgi:hypothetical protein